jgi:hypothetical protein
MNVRWKWLCLSLGALAACDGDSVVGGMQDAAPVNDLPAADKPAMDVAPDVVPDVASDLSPDVAPDAAPDAEPDATPDAEPDVTPDVAPDMGPTCPGGQTLCSGMCSDPQTDVANCGMCGRACAMGQGCAAGVCVDPPCPMGQTRCAGMCVDAQTDTANCGMCGRTCPMGQVCTAGACADPPCPMGQTRCGGVCVDTDSSNANCGMCGRACTAREMCSMGACASTCAAGTTDCGTTCNDLRTEIANCGMCGRSCPTPTGATATCAAGACGIACMTGLGDCDGMAGNGCEVDTRTAPAHCGGCGRACAAGQLCAAGACVDPPCPTGQTRCAGVCVDTATAESNCGMCGRVCASGPRGTPACVMGACRLTCEAGSGDCDGMAANGCEAALGNTAAHCGACGRACGEGQACVSGRCETTSCAPPAGCSGASCQTCGRVAFGEDWETGITAWNLARGGTAPITTATDSSDCRGRYLRETERVGGGRVFTRNAIPVTAGRSYCISSWIRGSAGTWPFVGIRQSDASAALGTEHWLIGQPCFGNGLGGSVAPVTSNDQWRWYAREFTMPATTHVVLELEIWDGGAPGTADFDQVQLLEGPCPQLPPATTCAAATCVMCPAGQTACGTTCTDLNASVTSCGACGRACAAGQRCIAGACGDDVSGNGSSGPLAVTTGTTTINTIRSPATGAMGATSVDLSTPTGFAAGQFIFLHQSQGMGVGAWEIAEITAVAGARLTVRNPLANAYSSAGTNRAQAVVMPQYTTVAVSGGTVTAPAWDGNTGGILAFLANGAVTVSGGAIDMSARGYRGTPRGTTANIPGFQGEGTTGASVRATAANGNGGGGGARTDCDCCWAGAGGGGGHGTPGTGGSVGGAACQAGGGGGAAIGNAAQTTIFFGGAGASGGADEDGHGSAGAHGGGIVYIAAASVTVSATGAVQSDGQAGQAEFNFSGCGSGGGGGGAGGAIYVRAPSVNLGTSLVRARGGVAGDEPGNCGTAGGVGGVGRITVRGAAAVMGTAVPPHAVAP